MEAARLSYRNRRSSQVSREETPQVARANADSLRQFLDGEPVEGILEQDLQGPGNSRRRAGPNGSIGRCFGMATPARPKSCLLGRRRTRKEPRVLWTRRPSRANRTTVHSGRHHSDKESSIESLITTLQGVVDLVAVQVHECLVTPVAEEVWPFSDLHLEPKHGAGVMRAWCPEGGRRRSGTTARREAQ